MWSPKQRQVFAAINDPSVSTIIIPGPTQSGKSISAVTAFMNYTSQYAGMEFIIGSHSQRQLEAAVLSTMHRWSDATGCKIRGTGEHMLVESRTTRVPNPAPNTFWPILGSNAAAEKRARGFPGVKAGLIDEATLWPEGAINQVIARCSAPRSKVVMLTNPAGPLHPLKVKYIDPYDPKYGGTPHPRRMHIPFEMSDNPSLTPEYIEDQKINFTGAEQLRMVYGEWAAEEGAVYPLFSRCVDSPPMGLQPEYYTGSADWGESNPTAVGLWAHYRMEGTDVTWLVREWYHDHRKKGHMPTDEQAQRVATSMFRGLDAPLRRVVVDRTATDFIDQLERNGVRASKAENVPDSLYPAIQLTNRRIENGTFRVSPYCTNFKRSMSNLIWDPNLKNGDKPLKQDDHAADAARYEVWADGGVAARDRTRRPVRVARAR